MYVDADEPIETAPEDDELTVTVDGEDYEAEAEVDVDHDGHNETAVVGSDDGGTIAFSDTDGDGQADLAVERDEDGQVEGAAKYDEASGEWVPVDPNAGQPADDDHVVGADDGVWVSGDTEPIP